jgi:hypothetical protein
MKKIFVISSFIFLLTLSWLSCKKGDLNLKPTLPTDATYFKTVDQMNSGVIAIYSKLVFLYNYRAGNWLHDIRLLPDDDLTTNSVDPFEVFNLITPTTGKVNDYYGFLYQLNARANDMLDIFAKNADIVYGSNTTLKNSHKGEALFLRGFSNWLLWNYYGVAPLITSRITTTAQLYPSNSTGTQLLDAAITDFTAAAALLPQTWDPANVGRATKGAAFGMAGKALLFRATVNNSKADYSAALAQFNQISGYALTANYYDNFDASKENNSESLFEVQLGRNSDAAGSNPWLSADQFAGNGDISGYYGYFDNNFSLFGTSRFFATKSIQNLFTSADPRYAVSLTSNGFIVKYVKYPTNESPFAASYDNNQRVLRYADVLLMEAEALVQSGGSTSQAIALINQVRTRAQNQTTPASLTPANYDPTVTDPNTIMKWIINERRIELAFEDGIRWLDLRRWDMGGQLQALYGKTLESGWDFSSNQSTTTFTKKNLYLPIPFNELQLNSNLKQNTLWQ